MHSAHSDVYAALRLQSIRLFLTHKAKFFVDWNLFQSNTISNSRYNGIQFKTLNNDLDYTKFNDILSHYVAETVTATKYINKYWFYQGRKTSTPLFSHINYTNY